MFLLVFIVVGTIIEVVDRRMQLLKLGIWTAAMTRACTLSSESMVFSLVALYCGHVVPMLQLSS